MQRRNNNYEARRAVYRLKHSHGDYVLIQVRSETAQADFKTGTKTIAIQHIPVYKAVVIGVSSMTHFAYDLAYIATNKNFTYGGEFDRYDRMFLIDGDDLPEGFNLEQQSRIIWKGHPHRIEKFFKTVDGYSYLCGTKAILSEEMFAHASTFFNFEQSGEGT